MRFKKTTLMLTVSAAFLAAASCAYAESTSLYDALSRKASVPIFVSDIKDSSKDKKIDAADLKKSLESALAGRKSVHFQVVNDPAKAEYVIEGDMKDFGWTDHDPVDMLGGVAMAAADAAIIEDYAYLIGDFTVREVRSGRIAWTENLRATVTKKDMPEKDSLHLVNEEMAKVLVTGAFGKKKKR